MKKIAKATEINKRIRQIREQAGLTQKDFASKIGISRSFLSEIESCQVKPSIEALIGIIGLFDIDSRWLIIGEEAQESAAESFSEYGSGPKKNVSHPWVPLLAEEAAAGPPQPISETAIAEYIPVWQALGHKKEYCFYLRDDAMSPLLQRGALVCISPFSGALKKMDGKLIAVWRSKEGLTVRRLRMDHKHAILETENKGYPPFYLEKSASMVLFSVDWWWQSQKNR